MTKNDNKSSKNSLSKHRETRSKLQRHCRQDQKLDDFGNLLLSLEQVLLFAVDGCIPFTLFNFSVLFANAMLNGVDADMPLAIISFIEFLFFMLTRATCYEDFSNNNVKPMDTELVAFFIGITNWFHKEG